MNITDVRVRKVAKEGKMKAVVSITIDDEFVVHDIKVIEGEKGLFIAMPSRKATDGEYRDIAHPINSATRDRIQGIILGKYEEVMAAAKACGCHDFIMKLENGYQTICGSSGGHLSGGERQRISIARAMLKDAPIIILDEATSYTDPENEAVIQASLAKLVQGKTLLMIAHRLSTIADSDQILVVQNGKIIARGKQDELLENCSLYKEMWEAHMSVKDSDEEVRV